MGDTDKSVSKTRRKREAADLQALGEALIEVPEAALETLEIPEPLKDAVRAARGMRKHGALNRQKQFIGKLMRDVDPAPIRAWFEAAGAAEREAARQHRLAEQWRRRLIENDAAIDEFLQACPSAELTELRRRIEAARDERAGRGPAGGARALFRLIRESLAAQG
jgi:ribosome-associated protein